MQLSDLPTRFPVPFANAAGPTYTAPVPTASPGVPGRASLDTGFPPETFTPVGAGGTPPFGQDFNGLFQQITDGIQWTQAGGQAVYNAAFQTAIGGYPKGAVVLDPAIPAMAWQSTTENNVTDPTAGGAGWTPYLAGRFLNRQIFNAAGSFTYTPTPGTQTIDVQVQGAGGAGGGGNVPSAPNVAVGIPGGAGAWAEALIAKAVFGASQTVTVGAAGVASVGAGGGNGGQSSFGALITCPGGVGGSVNVVPYASPFMSGSGGQSGAPGGTVAPVLAQYGQGVAFPTTSFGLNGGFGGVGGVARWGSPTPVNAPNTVGQTPTGAGCGGGGVAIYPGAGASVPGGTGGPGIVIIDEYS